MPWTRNATARAVQRHASDAAGKVRGISLRLRLLPCSARALTAQPPGIAARSHSWDYAPRICGGGKSKPRFAPARVRQSRRRRAKCCAVDPIGRGSLRARSPAQSRRHGRERPHCTRRTRARYLGLNRSPEHARTRPRPHPVVQQPSTTCLARNARRCAPGRSKARSPPPRDPSRRRSLRPAARPTTGC